jgi:hypothetical protein
MIIVFIDRLNALCAEVLNRRRSEQLDEEGLTLTLKLLEINPEFYTVSSQKSTKPLATIMQRFHQHRRGSLSSTRRITTPSRPFLQITKT